MIGWTKTAEEKPDDHDLNDLVESTRATELQLQHYIKYNNNKEGAARRRKQRACGQDMMKFLLANPDATAGDKISCDKKAELIKKYGLRASYVKNLFTRTKSNITAEARLAVASPIRQETERRDETQTTLTNSTAATRNGGTTNNVAQVNPPVPKDIDISYDTSYEHVSVVSSSASRNVADSSCSTHDGDTADDTQSVPELSDELVASEALLALCTGRWNEHEEVDKSVEQAYVIATRRWFHRFQVS